MGDGRFSEPTLKKRFYGEYKNTLFLCKQVIGEHSKLGASQKATVCVPPSKGSEGKKKGRSPSSDHYYNNVAEADSIIQ